MNLYTISAYWKPRRESIEECADRLIKFMGELQQCDEKFAHWYYRGRSRKDALKRMIDIQNRQNILKLLDKGRHRKYDKREIIEDLGFSHGIWNGRMDEKEAALSFICGSYSEAPGLGENNVLLKFHLDLSTQNQSWSLKILSAVIQAWSPDWAGLISDKAKDNRQFSMLSPFVDWMVYVPREISYVPPPASLVKLTGFGSIIIVKPTPPSIENYEDLSHIKKIEEIVRQ